MLSKMKDIGTLWIDGETPWTEAIQRLEALSTRQAPDEARLQRYRDYVHGFRMGYMQGWQEGLTQGWEDVANRSHEH